MKKLLALLLFSLPLPFPPYLDSLVVSSQVQGMQIPIEKKKREKKKEENIKVSQKKIRKKKGIKKANP